MITVRTKLLVAVAKWAAEADDSRTHLRAVLFAKQEIIACDGHRLVRVPVAFNNGPAFGVDRNHIMAAAAAQRETVGRELTLESDGKSVTIGIAPNISMLVPLRDAGKFPPVDKVMPKGPGGALVSYGFDPRYLAAIAEVQEAAGAGPESHGVRVTGWSDDALGAMLFDGFDCIRYVIMPTRI